ncbi:MAG TPA: carbohydrate ABC transporter permease [Chthonomonadaceae bacterium]|nr:carbohydrate ABC transporter permease [Chthonomonadaceae bacterium]
MLTMQKPNAVHAASAAQERQRARRRTAFLRALGAHAALLGIGLFFGLPFYWLVSTSLKPDAQVFKMPPVWVPHPIQWRNYPHALTYIPFLQYTLNTLLLCALNVVGTVLSCSLVAYSLAKIRWRGREWVFASLLATMILPGQVTMIPTFAIFKWLGWIGSYKPLWVPAFFGSAFNIFLLRQFFMTIPNELSDAARIDGCTEFGTYARVILPLARPALATVALFTFIGTWNDFLGPLLYLNDERTYTLSLGLQRFVSQHGAEWGMLMAASTVMTVPIIIVFFLAQRTFIQGVTLTGIKG